MPENGFLSQEEIDALLRLKEEQEEQPAVPGGGETAPEEKAAAPSEEETREEKPQLLTAGCQPSDDLTPEEKDALGEIGNITMGSAATALSELLNQRVTITSPRVMTCTQENLFATFKVPYVLIQVEFTEGLEGLNVLVIRLKDAAVIADLMMGGDGTKVAEQVTELELSAASEAMNQMIGTASTSLATMFGRVINISPPKTVVLEAEDGARDYRLPIGDPIVVTSFKMTIGELVDTEIMQIMSLQTAKEEAALLLGQVAGGEPTSPTAEKPSATEPADTAAAPPPAEAAAPAASAAGPASRFTLTEEELKKLELLLDVPLKVSVVLGRTRRPIREVLGLTPGAIVELSSLVDEPVEVLVNGVPVARGEVVVVNENFGVRITSIISLEERLGQLGVRH